MRKLTSVSIGMFLVCGFLFPGAELYGAMPDETAPRVVKYSDIPTKVKVVGRLGTHLGEEIITIRGTWKQPEAVLEDTFKFVVTSINGKEIQTPIEIPCSDVEPVGPRGNVTKETDGSRKWVVRWDGAEHLPRAFEGDEWEMKGFETGHTDGWPLEVRHIFGPVRQPSYRPGEFVSVFAVASVRMFNKPHDESELDGFPLGPQETEHEKDSSEQVERSEPAAKLPAKQPAKRDDEP